MKPLPEPDSPVDFGNGFVARKLSNGQWCLFKNGLGCDLKCAGYKWEPNTRFFKDCLGSYNDVDFAVKDIMAMSGI